MKPTMASLWWESYLDNMGKISRGLSRVSGRLGGFTARRPKTVMVVAFLLAVAACMGWLRLKSESNSDKLWVPQDNDPQRDRAYVLKVYGTTENAAALQGLVAPAYQQQFGGNAIQLGITWELFKVHEAVLATNATYKNQTYSYVDICYRTVSRKCAFNGYLQYWNSSFTEYLANVSGSAADPTAGSTVELYKAVNALTDPDGSAVIPLSILGDLDYDVNTLQVKGAGVLAVQWPVDKNVPDDVANPWYDAFTATIQGMLPTLQYVQLEYAAGNSIDKAVSKSITGSLYLVGISIALFVVMAVIGMSRWDRVATRSSLALIGVGSVVLGLAAGYGLSMLFGIKFTSLEQTLPFILLGVGIDIMFILVKGLDEIDIYSPSPLTQEQRFTRLMETSGLSTLIVGFANILAFGLGAITSLPAITWFCEYATLSIACILAMQLTFFIGAFVLSERRIAANRIDCCCCATAAVPNKGAAATNRLHEGWLRAGISKYYAPFLLHPAVKAIVIAAFLAFAAVSGYGISQLREGQPLEDLVPDGEYVKAYLITAKNTFDNQIGDSTGLYFRNIDQSDPANQAKMLQALNMTLDNPYINDTLSAFTSNWLISFITYTQDNNASVALVAGCFNPYVGRVTGPLAALANPVQLKGCIPQAEFYPLLDAWLALPKYRENADNIVRNATTGTVITSNLAAVHTAPHNDGKYTRHAYNAIKTTFNNVNKQVFSDANPGQNYTFFIYESAYIYWAGDSILPETALVYAILAVCGVGIVMLVLIVHPLPTLLLMGAVALVVLFLYGEMWIFKIRLNDVSVVNMVMATGLAVDYSVYFVQKFMATPGTDRNARVAFALTDTGAAIFLGGLTALIGSIPLAFANSTILRTFFALLFGTILFAALVGLVLLPVVFSLVGPARTIKVGLDDLPTSARPDAGGYGSATSLADSADSIDAGNLKAPIAVSEMVTITSDASVTAGAKPMDAPALQHVELR